MALTPWMLEALVPRLKAGQAIASMGYPDIISEVKAPKYRDDSEAICKRHGVKFHQVPDSESFFEQYGVSLDVYDVVQERGCEIVCDLNYPLSGNARYDFVLDVGTLEHCFNIAQAAVNMACLLKVGGTIFHENPFNWGNHGFYGLNPTWYHDFYTDNGFEVEDIRLVRRDGKSFQPPPTTRFIVTGAELNCLAIAKRIEDRAISWPTQTKYRQKVEA